MPKNKKILGILGGMGPLASARFLSLVTRHTAAICDSDHIDSVTVSAASIPDRTAFILGKSTASPVEAMKKGIKTLCDAGAEIIAVPCNTAFAFIDEMQTASRVPIINTVREAILYAKKSGARQVGILATDGTRLSGIYSKECACENIACKFPQEDLQNELMEIIYGIKSASSADGFSISSVLRSLFSDGCDCVILGCTELSLIPIEKTAKNEIIIDSLDALAASAIRLCGGTPTGFDDIYII